MCEVGVYFEELVPGIPGKRKGFVYGIYEPGESTMEMPLGCWA